MIGILDYGLGNISAFENIYLRLGIPVLRIRTIADFEGCSRLILPGVGAFDWAMQKLNGSGLRESLEHFVLEKEIPILGVCVGMQMMANTSEEGQLDGLGWIPGTVKIIDATPELKLPHMGWNDVNPRGVHYLFNGVENVPQFYFLHSYTFATVQSENIIAETTYGATFPCVVGNKHIIGTQFHPEKSHHWGVAVLKNFAEA